MFKNDIKNNLTYELVFKKTRNYNLLKVSYQFTSQGYFTTETRILKNQDKDYYNNIVTEIINAKKHNLDLIKSAESIEMLVNVLVVN